LFGCAAVPDAGCTEALAVAFCEALPCVGSETAAVLSGRAATGCAETAAVKDVTDVNASATEALMNPRGIDT
jgi:hypothetical protein